jgi:hypothetical protein
MKTGFLVGSHRPNAGAAVQSPAVAGDPVGPFADRQIVNAKVITLDAAPEGYAAFDTGLANKSVGDPHGGASRRQLPHAQRAS